MGRWTHPPRSLLSPLLLLLPALAFATPRSEAGSREAFDAFVARGSRAAAYAELQAYLEDHDVADVVPVWHLLRQGTDWRAAGTEAFALPHPDRWPGMVATLQAIRDDIVPAIGPIEVVSGFRTATYNASAGGASRSRHLHFEAIDAVPVNTITREALHRALLGVWRRVGGARHLGLGLYSGTRFHVDTWRFRRW